MICKNCIKKILRINYEKKKNYQKVEKKIKKKGKKV